MGPRYAAHGGHRSWTLLLLLLVQDSVVYANWRVGARIGQAQTDRQVLDHMNRMVLGICAGTKFTVGVQSDEIFKPISS